MKDYKLEKYLIDICKAFNDRGVKYLVIGGTASYLHGNKNRQSLNSQGHPLGKYDYDFLYHPSYKNYHNLVKAIKDYGLGRKVLNENKLHFRAPIIKPQMPKELIKKFKVDIVPDMSINAVKSNMKRKSSFEYYHNRRKIIQAQNNIDIPVISLFDLIKVKKESGRARDWQEAQTLQEIYNKRQLPQNKNPESDKGS